MSPLPVVAMPQPTVRVAAPREDPALGEQAAIHLLPAHAIVLNDRLIRYSKCTAGCKAPICRIKPDRGLLKGFAGAAQGKEALRV